MEPFDYYRPQSLAELCQLLQQPGMRIIAGGTDVLPQMRSGRLRPVALVDISRLGELRFITDCGEWVEIGALSTFSDLLNSSLLRDTAPALLQAAAWVGAPMTRSRGTLGGNLGNASPAGDSLPALLVQDATVVISSQTGERRLALAQFFNSPGVSALTVGEYIHHVSLSKLPPSWGSAYIKRGPRRGMTIAIVSAAAAIGLDSNGHICGARLALGAVAPTVKRCPQTEALLLGHPPSAELWQAAAETAAAETAPIDDVRASRQYRRHAAGVLAQRALTAACENINQRCA